VNPPNIVAFVIRHLDRSASQLPAARAERLKAARNLALEHRKVRSSARLAGFPGAFHFDLLTQRALARTAVAMMIAAGLSFWHADRYITRTAELDTAILTDDMPIDVLTDKGFDQWLQSSGEH
jgi:hypothetical protein